MELFSNQAFVRLRNRAYGTYLYADNDGVGVTLKPQRASLHTAWQVQRGGRLDGSYILLRSAAYGRYLALSSETSWVDESHHAYLTVQDDYEAPEQEDILWSAAYVDNIHVVMLQAYNTDRALRASIPIPNRPFFGHAFVDYYSNYYGAMLHWTVEAIPVRPEPTIIPLPSSTESVPSGDLWRRIIYMRADDHGNVNPRSMENLLFRGYSLLQLRVDLARLLNEPTRRITLCARAGSQGRLTPLVIDLPSNLPVMEIIVLTTMSPAALALRHPDIDAQ